MVDYLESSPDTSAFRKILFKRCGHSKVRFVNTESKMIQVVDLKRLCDLMPFPLPRFQGSEPRLIFFPMTSGRGSGGLTTVVAIQTRRI
jgi:hypothetical protein